MATVDIDIEFKDGSTEQVYNVGSLTRTEDGIKVIRNIRGVPVTDADDTRANSITREYEGEEALEFPDGVITSIRTEY
jgi:hypothetical protein